MGFLSLVFAFNCCEVFLIWFDVAFFARWKNGTGTGLTVSFVQRSHFQENVVEWPCRIFQIKGYQNHFSDITSLLGWNILDIFFIGWTILDIHVFFIGWTIFLKIFVTVFINC